MDGRGRDERGGEGSVVKSKKLLKIDPVVSVETVTVTLFKHAAR